MLKVINKPRKSAKNRLLVETGSIDAGYVDPKKYDKHGNVIYEGQLGEAIDIQNYPADGLALYQKDYTEKLSLLMKFYEIDSSEKETCWVSLAIALANEHVPGFEFKTVKNKGGRPKRSITDDRSLYFNIKNYSSKSGKSISNSCDILCKNYPKYSTGRSLNSRYSEIKSKLIKDPEYKSEFLRIGIIESALKGFDFSKLP